MIHGNHWSSGMIKEVLRRIDAKDVENRVVNVAGAEGMLYGSFAEAVGEATLRHPEYAAEIAA